MTKLFVLLSILLSYSSFSAVITATCNCDWSLSSTWDLGRKPQAGDIVVIPASKSVNVANTETISTGSPIIIQVYGTLLFQNGKKLNLPYGSDVILFGSGKIDGTVSSGNSNSNLVSAGGTNIWVSGDGDFQCSNSLDLSTNPKQVLCPWSLSLDALPITIVYFKQESNLLKWKVTDASNFSHFVIQFSKNGDIFIELDSINYSDSKEVYEYEVVESGYYKLKLVDNDDSFGYSRTIYYNKIEEVHLIDNKLVIKTIDCEKTYVLVYYMNGILLQSIDNSCTELEVLENTILKIINDNEVIVIKNFGY